uniref:Uncharacterized protein n=1 Tax=Schistosoma japonicum TaxID=6182 RepID=C1LQN1_SCHJA|nr:hypothetical protein [Schistosoma japonicum]
MFYKKFLFLFMSSLLTCWGIDAPEYKSNTSAYPDLPEKLKMLLDEEKKGLYDALIQKFKLLENNTENNTAVNIQNKSWKEYYRLGALYATKFFQELLLIKGPDFKELSDKFKELHEKAKQLNKTKPANGDLEKVYPKSWEATKLLWKAAEEYFDQLNTTQHTNEKSLEQYLQASEKHDEHMTDGDLEKTLQNALEKMGKYLNASKEYFDQLNTTQHTNEKNLEQYLQASEKHDEHMNGDLEKTLQNALEKMGKYLNASKEYFDQLNTTQHTNEKNLKQFLEAEENFHEQLNKMKKFELKAIKANMKYKNNSDDIQNFEEYKNVSQKLFHEIGLSKEKRRETNLDYYKRVADYYSGIFLV